MDTKKEITQEEEKIARLEAKHGKIMVISFDDGEHIGYAKKPSRVVLGQVIARVQNDPIQAAEILVQNCLIMPESDRIFLEDDAYLLGAYKLLQELITIKDGEIKKK